MLKGFAQHGVTFTSESIGSKQVGGTCPFCMKEEKFFVQPEKGLWDCKTCIVSGNFVNFLMQVYQTSIQTVPDSMLKRLADNRGLKVDTLKRWKIGWDGAEFIIPMYSSLDCTHLMDARRYKIGSKLLSWKTTLQSFVSS